MDQSNTDTLSTYYLPMRRERHAIPLAGLHPNDLKAGAKGVIRNSDFPGPQHTTILNYLANSLGSPAGFPGYKKTTFPAIEAFKAAHGLRTRADLFGAGGIGWWPKLYVRDVADRVFGPAGDGVRPELPESVFTGDEFDWDRIDPYQKLPFVPWRQKYEAALASDEAAAEFVAHHFEDMRGAFNLLGDLLMQPGSAVGAVNMVYFRDGSDEADRDRTAEISASATRVFRRLIEATRVGWLDILPFNDQLVFLRGADGRYDFIFAGMRGAAPPAVPYADVLHQDDVPARAWLQKAFRNWDYFKNNGVRERDEHDAEKSYYALGGTIREYPGMSEIKRAEMERQGRLPPTVEPSTGAPGFARAQAAGRAVWVQRSPVTVADYEEFLSDTNYAARRSSKLEPLAPANRNEGHYPAAATYFDALAYAAWFERRHKRPVRLLSSAEYIDLHPGGDPLSERALPRFEGPNIEWRLPGQGVLPDWRWFDPNEWDAVEAHFVGDLQVVEHGGVSFYKSKIFGEWLDRDSGHSSAAVSTLYLTAIRGFGTPLDRDLFPAHSWGKYKLCKIGFRLCWDATPEGGER